MTSHLLTPEEAAAALRVPLRWIYAHKSDVGARRIGGYLRIPVESLDAYVNREGHPIRVSVDPKAPASSRSRDQSSFELTSLEVAPYTRSTVPMAKVTFRLPRETLAAARVKAAALRRSFSRYMRDLIERDIEG